MQHTATWMHLQRILVSERSWSQKVMKAICIAFPKWQNYRDAAEVSDGQGLGMAGGGYDWIWLWSGSMRETFVVRDLFCILSVVVITQIYTHTHTHKTGRIWLRSGDGINVHFLVMIQYYSYAWCYQHGKLGKGCTGSLCSPSAPSCPCLTISK